MAVWELSAASRRVAAEMPPAAVRWRLAAVVAEHKPRLQAAPRILQGVSSLPPILGGHPYTLTVERCLAIPADETLLRMSHCQRATFAGSVAAKGTIPLHGCPGPAREERGDRTVGAAEEADG